MIINYEKLSDQLLEAGMQPVRVRELVKQVKQDVIDWPEVYESFENCKWALERGFVPGRVKMFGPDFNEETYVNYYSDYDYFMAHPLNNHFNIWINDKLTLKYMLNTEGLAQTMPEYYLYIENDGHYTYLMDAPASVPRDKDFLYNLLVEKKHLALKPNNGAGGAGFFGLKYEDGVIYVNDEVAPREKIEEIKPLLNGYIVTEFIDQVPEMEEIFAGTANAFRILMYKKVTDSPEQEPDYGCLLAYARFGTSKSDGTSNVSHGGLAVTADWESGTYKGGFRGKPKYWGEEGIRGFMAHPDNGIVLDGQKIPHWDEVRDGLLRLCRYFSSLDYFGMDVVITEDGFKLCEINSAPSTGFGQFLYGKCCLDNDDARKFVESKKRPSSKSFIECFEAAIEEY